MPSRARLATVVVAVFWSSANEAATGITFTAARSHSTLDTVYSLGNLYDAQGKFPTTDMNVVTNPDVNDRDYSIGKDSGERLVIGHTGEWCSPTRSRLMEIRPT